MCWACLARSLDVKCPICKGKGKLKQTKKPKELIINDGKSYFKQYIYLKNYKIWPHEGSLSKQDCKFLKILDYCDEIGYKFDEMEAEQKKAEEKLRAKQIGTKR